MFIHLLQNVHTTLHCAPSRGWSTRNVKNRHVHHLISTKLHCVPPKCLSVQNCIVNLDLYASASHECVSCEPTWESVRFLSFWPTNCMFYEHHQKNNKKCLGWPLHLKNIALYCWGGAQRSLHKPTQTHIVTDGTDSITSTADEGGNAGKHISILWSAITNTLAKNHALKRMIYTNDGMRIANVVLCSPMSKTDLLLKFRLIFVFHRDFFFLNFLSTIVHFSAVVWIFAAGCCKYAWLWTVCC